MVTDICEIATSLKALGQVMMQIQEYRATFGYLEVLLVDERVRKLGRVCLTDCFYICGNTSGGPYDISIREERSGEEAIVVLGAGDAFVAKALRACFVAPDEQ